MELRAGATAEPVGIGSAAVLLVQLENQCPVVVVVTDNQVAVVDQREPIGGVKGLGTGCAIADTVLAKHDSGRPEVRSGPAFQISIRLCFSRIDIGMAD